MPIAVVDINKIEERADLFEYTAGKLLEAKSFEGLEIEIDPFAMRVAAEAYFYLSTAYKADRIPQGSKSMPSKVAAMTALAIGTVQPLRPPSLDVNREEYLFINGAFALKVACGLQCQPFNERPFDDRLRWYRMVQKLLFPSLEALLDEANRTGKIETVYEPKLSEDELAKIDSVVAAFVAMVEG